MPTNLQNAKILKYSFANGNAWAGAYRIHGTEKQNNVLTFAPLLRVFAYFQIMCMASCARRVGSSIRYQIAYRDRRETNTLLYKPYFLKAGQLAIR